ncbi:heat shock protein, alpha-crystallin-related, b11 [Esox lucius]|uniref:Heat shock protein beta-11 n=1 Tax=Esox lucius TaxID=8010 RepID=C1BXD1_ESOLU|nr:heat shock protein beta-11 [Esox lucius]ACO13684.1 Heat shock protein beta-11 [Esox lucius]
MLCSSMMQPSLNTMSPFMDFHWPVRSLWPETRPLFFQIEQEMMRNLQEMRHNMEYMQRLHQKIFEDIEGPLSLTDFKPIAFQVGKENNRFALTLDTKDFSPEELSVKQVGRKLRVSGKTEKKQGDGKGSYSYKCQEFRQEFDLPEGVNPETVTCSLKDGQLQIHAPKVAALTEGSERVVPITCKPAITSPGAEAEVTTMEAEPKKD